MKMGINDFSAKEVINILEEKELAQIFKYFGDEKDSNRIAHNIVEDRETRKITTEELVRIIESSKRKKNQKTHSATKVFQALRIFVNKEISELIYGLINAAKVVKKDGVIAVVTFHSIEDKIVKPSRDIFVGDKVRVRKNQIWYELTALDTPKSRVGAKLVNLYREDKTPKDAFEIAEMQANAKVLERDQGTGRPTKKDRREIDEYREEDT